jgi:hypothetical protein
VNQSATTLCLAISQVFVRSHRGSPNGSLQVKWRSCTGQVQCERCSDRVCSLLHFGTRVRSEAQRGDNGLGMACQNIRTRTGASCDLGGALLRSQCPPAFVPIRSVQSEMIPGADLTCESNKDMELGGRLSLTKLEQSS